MNYQYEYMEIQVSIPEKITCADAQVADNGEEAWWWTVGYHGGYKYYGIWDNYVYIYFTINVAVQMIESFWY